MSRTEARIHVSCWHDSDFLGLASSAQHAFFLLISQPNITFVGVLALNIRGWATLAPDLGPIRFRRLLAELVAKRFILVDETTGELWIRSFVKYDGILSSPNLIVAMSRDYGFIRSPVIRGAFLDRLGEGFREGFHQDRWERLGEPFREGYGERFPLAGARHAEPPPPPPPPPPPTPEPIRRPTATSAPPSPPDGPAAEAPGRRRDDPRNDEPPTALVDATIRHLAQRRLITAQADAAAGHRAPITNPAAWTAKVEPQIRGELNGELTTAWHLAGHPTEPATLAAAFTHLPDLRAQADITATLADLEAEHHNTPAEPLIDAHTIRTFRGATQ